MYLEKFRTKYFQKKIVWRTNLQGILVSQTNIFVGANFFEKYNLPMYDKLHDFTN